RLLFFRAQAAAVGGRADQALELVEERADLVEATLGGADDVARPLGVVDGRADAGLLGAEVLAGDEARGIVLTAVDLQTGAQPLEAGVELVLVAAEHPLGDQRADVRINPAHGYVSP